ncbi:Gfo/Idh/MocA family oxidoreductase [Anabaena sphaerica FACHB-251]|uniref:Gfo/Idh/MocA family oxidoreductase n=1 Tax=Anabaena sphaerica FACHB-251 TaxID=2692883 RepID=A0A926WKJ4_9NOST|nr:Gfo/Idh/MocA family oxidoreductase [Anabaena sphaerica]MBD2295439.1 Gfo/Idh/MocA family oxidoreductase [Anabaena sphaerica FACHB-251]
MYNSEPPLNTIMRVGLVGTGYAAKLRAEALRQDPRTHLVAITGHTPEKTAAFAQEYQTEVMNSWQQLVEREDLDLLVISTINRDHGKITHAALTNDKHVIVEYPLSVDVKEAEELIALAKAKNKLLHVEHIELLGGWHQALKQNLAQLGELFYVRYSTVKPEHPAPRKWTYHHERFGFPLVGALSRLHRLTDLFGEVFTVNCHQRYWETETNYYQSCLCMAQLCFTNGLLAQVIYGKGETLWQSERKFEINGEKGGLILDGDTGILVQAQETKLIDIGTRRGLFAKDTKMVLDHLFYGAPLYVTAESSLYTLKVAEAARRAAETGITIFLTKES